MEKEIIRKIVILVHMRIILHLLHLIKIIMLITFLFIIIIVDLIKQIKEIKIISFLKIQTIVIKGIKEQQLIKQQLKIVKIIMES